MKYGFVFAGGDVRDLVNLAHEADEAGWDGVFVPDCICIDPKLAPDASTFDPWVALAGMAVRTERVKLGTMLTPVSRRRPWKLAREVTTLDVLSNGRAILPVGLGAIDDLGFGGVGEATGRKERAELLDEGLEIIDRLWSGGRVDYTGKHYRVEGLQFIPRPVQSPRVPVWVVGMWPKPRSMQRVLKWDGLLPNLASEGGAIPTITPEHIAAMRSYISENRQDSSPFDIVMEGETGEWERERAIDHVRRYEEAGATWWIEAAWSAPRNTDPDWIRDMLVQGPPRHD